jgi:hypothetical protein
LSLKNSNLLKLVQLASRRFPGHTLSKSLLSIGQY